MGESEISNICSNCGETISKDNAKYCAKCGAKIENIPQNNEMEVLNKFGVNENIQKMKKGIDIVSDEIKNQVEREQKKSEARNIRKMREKQRANEEQKQRKIDKSLIHPEKVNLDIEIFENVNKFETETSLSGLLSFTNAMTFNSFQQMMAKSTESQIRANRVFIQQNELKKSNEINQKLLELLDKD